MTPTRLRECLHALDWSQRGLAAIVHYNERQARRWASGDSPIPHEIADWLERAEAWMLANPPPRR